MKSTDVLVLTEKDVDDYPGTKGKFVEFILVPESRRGILISTDCWKAMYPCIAMRAIVAYYDPLTFKLE